MIGLSELIMHGNRHRIVPTPRSQSTTPLPCKNWGADQIVLLGVSFAATLFLTLVAAAHESTVALSGTVVDADGNPAADVAVIVAEGSEVFRGWKERSHGVALPAVLGTATSDPSGGFTVEMPAEAAEFIGRRSRLTVWAYHAGAALRVHVIDRDWLAAGLPLRLALGRIAPLRLKVVGDDWRPVAHARIAPHRVADQLVPAMIADRVAVTADAKGMAELTDFERDGLDAVRVEHRAYGIQWISLPRADMDATAIVSLAPVGRLTGRLIAADVAAVRGRKLRFITWRAPHDDTMGVGVAEVVTDEEGQFDVSAIAAGSLTFEIDRGQSRLSLRESVPLRGAKGNLVPAHQHASPAYLSDQTTGPQVEPHETIDFEIPLRRAVLVTQEVRDRDDGRPIAGVVVSLNWAESNDVQATTDASGQCRAYLLPGMFKSRACRLPPPYYYPKVVLETEVVREDCDTITFQPMRLARGAAVRGRVVDAAGQPVAGSEIFGLWPVPPRFNLAVHAWTNAAGEFAIAAAPTDVELRLWTSHGEALTVDPVLARTKGEPVTLTVREGASVSLDGRVIDATGRPVDGARVRVWGDQTDRDQNEPPSVGALVLDGRDYLIADADGRFRTPRWLRSDLAYTLDVEAPGMVPVKTEAIVPQLWKTTHFADVVLHPAPRLRAIVGQVVDSAGHPLAGAAVWQSGDGPRRTQTITNADGRFVLHGAYDGPAYIFARQDGYRMRGVRAAAASDTCEIVLLRGSEPCPAMTTRPPLVPLEERRRLGMSLLEPMLPILREPVFKSEHFRILSALVEADPNKALEISDNVLTNPQLIAQVRSAAALALLEIDFDESLAAIALVSQTWQRAQAYLNAWDRLTDKPRGDTDRLLHEALLAARAEADAAHKLELLGQIGDRWFDLGERERGTTLLREGQALALQLPSPSKGVDFTEAMHFRAMFAGPLARIDGPAAIALTEGFEKPRRDLYHAAAARGLAEHDAAEAERMLNLLELPSLRFVYGLAVFHRMAAIDPDRAVRLARGYPYASQQGYALGIIAHRLADTNRAAATRLMDEAYVALEGDPAAIQKYDGSQSAATRAAGLLPVAEKIDPRLVEGFFWRAMAMRLPRRLKSGADHEYDHDVASFAALVARYDPAVARDLIEPFAGRLRELAAEASSSSSRIADWVFMALAVSDARWAYELVQSLPDAPVKAGLSPKQSAARLVAAWLGYSPRELWRVVYDRCTPRNPDVRDEQR
jgi:hypothetical protein